MALAFGLFWNTFSLMLFREEVTAIKDSVLYWYWIFLCLISSKLPRQTFDHLQVSLDSSCLHWLPETNESVKM